MNLGALFSMLRQEVHFGRYQTLLLGAFDANARGADLSPKGLRYFTSAEPVAITSAANISPTAGQSTITTTAAIKAAPDIYLIGHGPGYWVQFYILLESKERPPCVQIEMGDWELTSGIFTFQVFDKVTLWPDRAYWRGYVGYQAPVLTHLNGDAIMARALLLLGADDALAAKYGQKDGTGHERLEHLLEEIDKLGLDREAIKTKKVSLWAQI